MRAPFANFCSQKLNDLVLKSAITIFIPTIGKINDLNVSMAMDVVQKQMLDLNDKVDSLHRLVEQLTDKVTGIAAFQARYQSGDSGAAASSGINQSPVAFNRTVNRVVDPSMTHKDILSDEPQFEGDKSSSAHTLSPEIQIQRLTAQLTAAYNRMAALEEQIMACRFQ